MIELVEHRLDDRHSFFVGALPDALRFDAAAFDALWNQHPEDFHQIRMGGRLVKTPRWQQAYGADYHYTGRVNRALPMLDDLKPVHHWAQAEIDARLNGVLLNWYAPDRGHYIGRHRDSTVDMVRGSPIVTVSLGGARTFRLRKWRAEGVRDFVAADGVVFVLPYDTNLAWTHEVPTSAKDVGRRISITLRAFHVR
ncbi:MAG: alpha-ketoglutarate-dependent dioxygenase AlkB [Polyangiales bacterium]